MRDSLVHLSYIIEIPYKTIKNEIRTHQNNPNGSVAGKLLGLNDRIGVIFKTSRFEKVSDISRLIGNEITLFCFVLKSSLT